MPGQVHPDGAEYAAARMVYTHVLLDFDHTLLDSDTSLAAAYDAAMHSAGLDPAEQYPTFDRINRTLWAQVERGTLTPPQVHTRRFERLLAASLHR